MIIMRQSDDPTTCMCCGRHALSIAVAKPKAREMARTWVCENPECHKATRILMMQKQPQLSLYEKSAIETVAKRKVEGVLKSCMEAMFLSGATDLNNLTADQIEMALDRLIVDGVMQEHARSIVEGFGDCIRASVANGDAPF
jgi:hypothetical protein